MKKRETSKIHQDFKDVMEIVRELMTFPCYENRGNEIFAKVGKAMSLDMSIAEALSGGLTYNKNETVEMPAATMNGLIRSVPGNEIKVEKSDEMICILTGKRADTGETLTESFTIKEAERAKITGNDVWKKYPKDMLFARALSRLARRLFADIINGCYTQGEISGDVNPDHTDELFNSSDDGLQEEKEVKVEKFNQDNITEEEVKELEKLAKKDEQFKERVKNFLSNANIESISCLPRAAYNKILPHAIKINDESLQKAS